jgi:hypothetical protein
MTIELTLRIHLCVWDKAVILVHLFGMQSSLRVNTPQYDFQLLLSKRQLPIMTVDRIKAIHFRISSIYLSSGLVIGPSLLQVTRKRNRNIYLGSGKQSKELVNFQCVILNGNVPKALCT